MIRKIIIQYYTNFHKWGGANKVVYGSRFLMGKNKHSYQTFYLGGRLVTFITNLLYNQNLTDEPTCYKAFHTDLLKSIPLECTGFEFCPEVTAKIALLGYQIEEVPIHYYPRSIEEGEKIKWTDGLEAIYVLFKYFLKDLGSKAITLFKQLSINYLILLFCCILSIMACYMIPRTETMKQHLSSALQTVLSEGTDKRACINMMLFDLDNATNHIMIAKSAYQDHENWMKTALMNFSATDKEILEKQYQNLQSDAYGRYWHGYLIALKPVFLFMDYHGIRWFNYVLLSLLTISCVFWCYKRIDLQTCVIFTLSLCAVEGYIVPLSTQLSTMFYITLSASLIVLLWDKQLVQKRLLSYFFFTIGGLTSFFDFLTTPVLSLGLPLTLHLLLNKQGNNWRQVITMGIIWLAGYASIWLSKWILVSIFTDHNMLLEAFQQMSLHMGLESSPSTPFGEGNILFERINTTFSNLPSNPVTLLLVIAFIIGCITFALLPKKGKGYNQNVGYLLIALIPIVWYLATGNHTGVHWRFTHRSLWVTYFSLTLFLLNLIDWKRIKEKVCKKAYPS